MNKSITSLPEVSLVQNHDTKLWEIHARGLILIATWEQIVKIGQLINSEIEYRKNTGE